MVTTLPTWLVLLAALGGGVIGALISGILLILNSHLQAKSANELHQRDFERLTRAESLNRVKVAIDQGYHLFNSIRLDPAMLDEVLEHKKDEILHYGLAITGARIAAGAIGAKSLLDTIDELTIAMNELAQDIDNTLLSKTVEPILIALEKQYIELKIKL